MIVLSVPRLLLHYYRQTLPPFRKNALPLRTNIRSVMHALKDRVVDVSLKHVILWNERRLLKE